MHQPLFIRARREPFPKRLQVNIACADLPCYFFGSVSVDNHPGTSLPTAFFCNRLLKRCFGRYGDA
ncbi:hypothetical protein [Stakelama sediminis]|uniref:hypothetical protein n=1 Tax=Stakelama sediminis TaxID=463200 RepID=UPI0031E598C3